MVENTLYLMSEILRHPSRVVLSRPDLLIAIHLVLLAGQDKLLVMRGVANMTVTKIIHSLLDRLPATNKAMQDLSEFIIMRKTCPDTVTWDYAMLPSYFADSKFNHPHNMLHLLTLLPGSGRGRQLASVLAYLFLQLTLNVQAGVNIFY